MISTLAKTSGIKIVKSEADIPKGCGTSNIGTTKIFVALKQYLDLDKETDKLNKKLGEIQAQIDRIIKKTEGKDYEQKASEKAKKENEENLAKYRAEFAIVK